VKNYLRFYKNRIVRGNEIVRLYSNWWLAFFYYLRFIKSNKVVLILHNGMRYEFGGHDFDAIAAISDVWLRKEYTPIGNEIKSGSVVIDIGAHIGDFSIFASKYDKDIAVFSYEPSKESFTFLIRNIELNKASNIKAFNLAVSKTQGEIKFYIDEKNTTLHSTVIAQKSFLLVPSTTLERIFMGNHIENCQLLKLDCEGAEYEILFNTPGEILNRIQNISMEYHDVPNYTINDLKKYLKDMGFDVRLGKEPFLYASANRR
jgi:FkbM family methyltransferase